MGADERQPETIGQIQKKRTQRKPGTALKEVRAQFANAEAAMDVWIAEGRAQLKQSEQNLGAFVFWQREKLLLCVGADDE